MKKHIIIIGLAFSFIAGAGINAATGFFPDVPSHAWFAQYVNTIKDWGVIDGNDDGTFAPGDSINRAEFSKMLYQYDKRVDQKIENSGSKSATTSRPRSTMYITAFNRMPANCPSGWTQASVGKNWESGGQFSWDRACYTTKSCTTIQLENFNAEAEKCPSGWLEVEDGVKWTENGKNKYQRICTICS